MAAALARGWGDPVLATDSGSGKAAALAEELGGEAVSSTYELAVNSDVIVLAHKPAQLEAVAREAAPAARGVVSLLGRLGEQRHAAADLGRRVGLDPHHRRVRVGRLQLRDRRAAEQRHHPASRGAASRATASSCAGLCASTITSELTASS